MTPRVELADLVRRILNETLLEQLRFSSIEPQDVTEDFVALVAASPRIAPHFHVPLQSGSDRILRAMHRWYRAAHYAERIQLIRSALPDAAIGADVIAGFPGETDEDFAVTFDFIVRLPFTYLHVFSFSARPGTKAADLGAPVSPAVTRDRARALRSLGQQKSVAFRELQAGRTVRALTLARGGDSWTEALTGNYLKVRVEGRWPANIWCEASHPCGAGSGRTRRSAQFSKITSASARFPLCVIVSEMFFTPSRSRKFACHSVQSQRGFAGRLAHHFYIAPAHAESPARSQRFHRRFFGGKSSRVAFEFAAKTFAVRHFRRSV